MLEMLIAALQWTFITGVWAFTAVGFYRSYQEIKRVYRIKGRRSRGSNIRQAPYRNVADEWLMAA